MPLKPAAQSVLQDLVKEGYGIFSCKRGSPVPPVRWTAESSAPSSAREFIDAFGEKKDPFTGYLNMQSYLSDKLVQYLLSEILSQQSVASAA